MIIIIASDKINLRTIFKTVLCLVLCSAMVLGIHFSNGGFVKENDVFISGGYGHRLVYVKSEKDFLISYGVAERDELENFALKNRINGVDGLIILGNTEEINSSVPVFLAEIYVKKLYVMQKADYLSSIRTVDVIEQKSTFNCGDAAITFLESNILKIVLNGDEYLFVNNANNVTVEKAKVDVLLAYSHDMVISNLVDSKKYIFFEDSKDYLSVRRTGNLHIRAENGIISIRRRGVL